MRLVWKIYCIDLTETEIEKLPFRELNKSGADGRLIMLETADKVGYEEWDNPQFAIPENFHLDENSKLHEAINVFYMAGGYDFFKVTNPQKYASNWLDFIGSLYSEIEKGKYKPDGKYHKSPLTEEQRNSLIKQGVPEIFTNDIK